MEKWEFALDSFIKKWKTEKDVIGAIACGSYITGNPSKHSDIDLHIILDKNADYRIRGNEIVNGILIEYFINPISKHYEYFKEDLKSGLKMNAHMLATGKIIFDKTGELKSLKNEAKKALKIKYPKMGKIEVEFARYHIWDALDNLEEVFESDGDEFNFVYYNYLYTIFKYYSKFVRFDCIQVQKAKRLLVNDFDKNKYKINDFPDKRFAEIFIETLKPKGKNEMMKEYKIITNHVLDEMGGFDIDGWKIRTRTK